MSEDTVNELTNLLIGDILFEIILDTKSTQNKQSNQLLYNNPSNSSNNLDYCGIQKGTGDLQNPNFECLICKRQISSNRYAPHLNNCLGLGGSRLSSRNSSNASRNAQPAKMSKPTPTPASTTTTCKYSKLDLSAVNRFTT